jgi:catechol 2,3-dioxygenase-like lactoylglutathione lyase family enzyme
LLSTFAAERGSRIAAAASFCDVGKQRTSHRAVCLMICPKFSLPNAQLTFRVAVRPASREAHTVSVLHHLAIGTRDVARLARFYIDVLGLREVTRHLHADGSLRSVWLDLGGSLLMIEPTDEPPRTVVGVGAGPFLIAVAVSVDERAAFETRLAGAGSNIELRSEFTSYARDPDGNRIALSAFPLDLLEQD